MLINKEEEEEIISKLPTVITSKLTLKEIAIASAVSRKKMWEDTLAVTQRLVFEHVNIGDAAALGDYLRWVEQVMRLHNAPTLDELTLSFPLHGQQATTISDDIKKWVEFAAKKPVQKLRLDLWLSRLGYKPHKDINLANTLLNCLRYLRLEGIDASEKTIKCLSSNKPLLENLWLLRSQGLDKLEVAADDNEAPPPPSFKYFYIISCSELRSLKISSPSLERLHISEVVQLQHVEIRAPNLECLDITNNVALRHVTICARKLVKITFYGFFRPALMEIDHVSHLRLVRLGLKKLDKLDNFQDLLAQISYVKILTLKVSLQVVNHIYGTYIH